MSEPLFDRNTRLSMLQHAWIYRFEHDPACQHTLSQLGLSDPELGWSGNIGLAYGRYDHGRFFLDPTGIPSWTIATKRSDGSVFDIVAFAPGRCGSLDGREWILGRTVALAPNRLYTSPIDWMKAGGDGVFIFNRKFACRILLDEEIPLEVDTEQQKRDIEYELSQIKLPKITVSERPRQTTYHRKISGTSV